MTHTPLPIQRSFGETLRRDAWWLSPLLTFLAFSTFLIYGTWSALQGSGYTWGPYFSPFHAPEIWGPTEHAWFGPRPGWWPEVLFYPALIILPFPGLFRFTCYYYRGKYYKGFWQDPTNCAVGEARQTYRGERPFPNWLHNLHRYTMYIALIFIAMLAYDAYQAFWFMSAGNLQFGVGLGTIIMWVNVGLISAYTLGCHSLRHLIGGFKDRLSGQPIRSACYTCVSKLNGNHGHWAIWSMFSVALTDFYIRMVAGAYITDWRLF